MKSILFSGWPVKYEWEKKSNFTFTFLFFLSFLPPTPQKHTSFWTQRYFCQETVDVIIVKRKKKVVQLPGMVENNTS